MPHDQQSIEQAKRDCLHDKQIHRRDAVGMISDKGSPALGRRVFSPDHVFGDAGLADLNAELKQLAMDPRRSPQRIGNAPLADKLAYLRRSSGSAPTAPRLPPPARSEPDTMPTDDRL